MKNPKYKYVFSSEAEADKYAKRFSVDLSTFENEGGSTHSRYSQGLVDPLPSMSDIGKLLPDISFRKEDLMPPKLTPKKILTFAWNWICYKHDGSTTS